MNLGYITQLRFTDLEAAIEFYTAQLGFDVVFRYEDFYAGLAFGDQELHFKLVDEPEPNADYVRREGHLHLTLLVDNLVETHQALRDKGVAVSDMRHPPYGDEFDLVDPGGHTLYFSARNP